MAFIDIQGKVFLLRGQVVILDYDLAKLYDITKDEVIKHIGKSGFPWESTVFKITNDEWLQSPSYVLDKAKFTENDLPIAFTSQAIIYLSFSLNKKQQIHTSLLILEGFLEIYNVDPELYNRLDLSVSYRIKALKRFVKRGNTGIPKLSPPVITTEYLREKCKNKFTTDNNGLIRDHHSLYAYLYPVKYWPNTKCKFHIFVCEHVQNRLYNNDIDTRYGISADSCCTILDIPLNVFRKDLPLTMCNRCRNLLQNLISHKAMEEIDFTPIIYNEDDIQKHITINTYIKMMNKPHLFSK